MRHNNTQEKALVGAHLVSEGEDALAPGGGAGGGGDGLAGTGAGGGGGAVPPLVGHHLARARHLQHQHQQCANFSEIMHFIHSTPHCNINNVHIVQCTIFSEIIYYR